MKKVLRSFIVFVLAFVILCGSMHFNTTNVYAFSYQDLDWGRVTTTSAYKSYYRFTLTEKSHISIRGTANYMYEEIHILDSNGDELTVDKTTYTKNNVSGVYTYKKSVDLKAGTYYVYFYGIDEFTMTKEKSISLSKPTITKVTKPSSGVMKVYWSKVSGTTEYEVRVAKNSSFTSGLKTVKSVDCVETIKKLTKGSKYYVKVRAIAIYGDGKKVYSAWSTVKAKVV